MKLSKILQKDAEQEMEMRTEIQNMRLELSSISMMDEFARYARLERKINKMTDKLKTHGKRIRHELIKRGEDRNDSQYNTNLRSLHYMPCSTMIKL